MNTTRAACRACGGEVDVAFTLRVLGRHDASFQRCRQCGSLQAASPTWLDEAYDTAIAATDTGIMVRNLSCQAALWWATRTCRVRGRLLDAGGGAGILCRLLRDQGMDAYLTDRHADPLVARAYSLPWQECRPGQFAVVSAMEVLEHFDDPAGEIARLFSLRPTMLVAGTERYDGQGAGWWYLSAGTGQHLFFYSGACLRLLASRHGYHYWGTRSLHVFTQHPLGPLRRLLLRAGFSRVGLGLVRLWLALRLRGQHAARDHEAVVDGLARGARGERNDE